MEKTSVPHSRLPDLDRSAAGRRILIGRTQMQGSLHKEVANSQRYDESGHAVKQLGSNNFVIQDNNLSGHSNNCHQKDNLGRHSVLLQINLYALEEFQSD